MWADEAVFYQIYPLGLCGAPFENPGAFVDSSDKADDSLTEHRILKVLDFIPHIEKLNCNAVYFSPLFESDTHGYNTRDYSRIDRRLGTNKDFKKVCAALHKKGIKVVLDGVFNHVGRGFYRFQDVLNRKWDSAYKDWFHISFDGNSNYNDGLWYEGWEGNYDLVKLNLKNEEVIAHILDAVKGWVEEFDIDGLRLDVAYCLDRDFLKRLRSFTDGLKEDFFLVGEILGGDYKTVMNDEMCHSATNYECYKGLFSSFNSMNMFEIIHSLKRQFDKEPWCLYTGKHLLSFVDNHDVTRAASVLQNPEHLKPMYTLMFGMPGIPIIYYGSEWGFKADKKDGDPALRPSFDKPEWNELSGHIAALAKAERSNKALQYGDFKSLVLTNRQCIFEREAGDSRVMIAINADGNEYRADFDARAGRARDLVTGETVDFGGGLRMPAYSGMILEPY